MLNPNCDNCDNSTTVLHVRAVGTDDELHYLWDFTGKPAALLLYFEGTRKPVDMTMDWRAFFDGRPSIKFSRAPKYYFGVVLDTLYEYNDQQDSADFEHADPADVVAYSLQDFVWQRESFEVSEERAEVRVSAQRMVKNKREKMMANHKGDKGVINSGTDTLVGDLTLTFSTHGLAGHSGRIPHLLHTENATEIDLILKDMRVERNFSCPRMALGLTVVSQDDAKSNFSLNVRRSVDDEFTPGIFELIKLSSRGGAEGEGFVQYRPVSYTNEEREVSTSTLVRQSAPQHPDNQLDTLSETIVAAVEGISVPRALVENMNVSFGVKGDGCFGKTNYTTWTFITAYGQPMPERLSTLVVVLAALGLGLPLVLLISGGCFVCLRRARQSQ